MDNDERTRWPVALAAGAAVLIALTGVVLLTNRDGRTEEPDGTPAQEGKAPDTRADPARLVVRDGAEVQASGQVLLAPGKPARLCAPAPTTMMLQDGPPKCALGLDVVGVDPAALTGATVEHGVTVGQAWLRGTWRGGVLHVLEQGPPRPAAVDMFDDSVPCQAPKGGWKPGHEPDSNALHEYVTQTHPERFRALRVGYPAGLPTGPTDGPQPPTVMIVEVVSGDAAEEERELRRRYTGNLCVVAGPGKPSIAQLAERRARIEAVVDPLMRDPANGIFTAGGDDVYMIELMMLTQPLYDRFAEIGLDLLRIEPWLRPTVVG